MKRFAQIAAAALLIAGCKGGAGSTPQPPPPAAELNFRVPAIPQNHTLTFAKKQTAAKAPALWDQLFPTAYAQNPPSAVMTGNYSGYCPAVDTSFLSGPGTYTLFGMGILAAFDSQDRNRCGTAAIFSGPPAYDSPAPVIGDGTLQGLVVLDGRNSVKANANTGVANVWVDRGGQLLATALTCTLGQAHRCQDMTNTFPVVDGDGAVVSITFNPGDAPANVQVFLGKQ